MNSSICDWCESVIKGGPAFVISTGESLCSECNAEHWNFLTQRYEEDKP